MEDFGIEPQYTKYRWIFGEHYLMKSKSKQFKN